MEQNLEQNLLKALNLELSIALYSETRSTCFHFICIHLITTQSHITISVISINHAALQKLEDKMR